MSRNSGSYICVTRRDLHMITFAQCKTFNAQNSCINQAGFRKSIFAVRNIRKHETSRSRVISDFPSQRMIKVAKLPQKKEEVAFPLRIFFLITSLHRVSQEGRKTWLTLFHPGRISAAKLLRHRPAPCLSLIPLLIPAIPFIICLASRSTRLTRALFEPRSICGLHFAWKIRWHLQLSPTKIIIVYRVIHTRFAIRRTSTTCQMATDESPFMHQFFPKGDNVLVAYGWK